LPSKYKLPKIIDKYKLEKSENSEVELRIVENYYKQILFSEQLIKDSIKTLEQYEVEK
jgi:hypothetical protein